MTKLKFHANTKLFNTPKKKKELKIHRAYLSVLTFLFRLLFKISHLIANPNLTPSGTENRCALFLRPFLNFIEEILDVWLLRKSNIEIPEKIEKKKESTCLYKYLISRQSDKTLQA